ncbi:cytosolic protein [Effusibacillus dendaii]|uniref:Uncharacterized protein n=1 Tax=Effusibacillus dendaii TaxID=2743772 RepID=A0A7I8DA84_9BACL|nr:cytosolic protein [Effusibacillus dendaii]BCJ87005.1 hypothetical protein skT53_19900 [Effusibacillus dendaii]
MYVGRSLEELQNLPLSSWTMEELAYFKNSFHALEDYVDTGGTELLRRIDSELNNRRIPSYL